MKILLLAIPFDNGKSGISVYIREVIRALRDAGHSLTVVVEDDAAKEFRDLELIHIKKRRPLFSMLYTLYILPWQIRWNAYDFCIVLAANRRLFCRYPIYTIGVVHDLSQYHIPVKYDRFRMFYIRRVLPHYARKAQSICAISKSTRNDLVKYWHIPEKKITVVYNGFTPFPMPTGNKKKKKQILYVSRIEHTGKNHLNLLKAFELLPDKLRQEYVLVMAGSAWNGAETVYEYAKNSQCRKQFQFTGFVRSEDLPELYAQSALYVFPSLFEGFGLSLLEAMYANLPCVCSRTSSLGELGQGAAELFDPTSPQDIANAMEKILSNPELQQQLCRAGQLKVANFSWQNTARQLVAMYEDRTANLFGVSFFIGTMQEALQKLDRLVQSREQHHVAFVNAHCLNVAYENTAYRTALRKCSVIFADGIGVKIGAKLQGFSIEDNVNGTDMFPLLLQKSYRIYLLGGKPEVAQAALEKARLNTSKAELVGCSDGFFQIRSEREVLKEIITLKPDILLVGMGIPLQEMWIREHSSELPACVIIGVGGLLDFVSERIPRAPMWMRNLGLEWCFRLYQEPRRLFKRYVIGNPLFLWRVFRNKKGDLE